MKTYSLTLAVAAGMAAALTLVPAQAQQANGNDNGNNRAAVEQQLQQLQAQATGAAFEVADNHFRVVPNASLIPQTDAANADAGSGLVIADYRVQLQTATSRQARSTAAPASKQMLVMSDSGVPAVLTSTMKVFFNDPAALQQAANAAGGKVGYTSARAGMGTIEFDSAAKMLDAMSRVQGQAGIRNAQPELIQSKREVQ